MSGWGKSIEIFKKFEPTLISIKELPVFTAWRYTLRIVVAGQHVLTGPEIYNVNLPKTLNVLNSTLEQIQLPRPLNITESEYLNLRKKKALLMFLKGQLVEIFDLRTLDTNFGRRRQTHWRLAKLEDLKPSWDDRQFSRENEDYLEHGL